MFIQTLDVVNSCLATMGEAPLNSLEDDHSFKSAALNYLAQTNKIEQAPGFWFNSEYVHLEPDAVSEYIYIPMDALSIKPVAKVSPVFGQRGKRIYDPGSNSFKWSRGMWVDAVRLLEFEDLPYHMADLVQYGTIMRFQREFDGDTTRYQQLSGDYTRARNELRAEDVRNKRPNLLHRLSAQVDMQFIGPRLSSLPRIPIR